MKRTLKEPIRVKTLTPEQLVQVGGGGKEPAYMGVKIAPERTK